MGRLKKDHSGWRPSGMWIKYSSVTAVEPVSSHKKKKDTNRWCRGKVGREHVWHCFQGKRYDWDEEDYIELYVSTKCIECGKEKSLKTAKAKGYPLHLWIDDKSEPYDLVQVRVNGKMLPIERLKYVSGKVFCSTCGYAH